MSNVEEKLAKSLTAESTDIIPYLPYLLQDLWDLGSIPECIAAVLKRHAHITEQTRVLDLACGKGAVSVHLAKQFDCQVKGVDLIPEFVTYATGKAKEHGVHDLCHFQVGDINQAVQEERNYDVVVLGAVGDVLGDTGETLRKLRQTIRPAGFIVIDDVYGQGINVDGYPTREEWEGYFSQTRLTVVEALLVDSAQLKSINDYQQPLIVQRGRELIDMHPDKAELFDNYIASQQAECDDLENTLQGVTLLLQARGSA